MFQIQDGTGNAVAPFGPGRLEVLRGVGLRLVETTFHLDEGPELVYANAYRLLARGSLLGYARTRPVDLFEVREGVAVAAWEPFDDHRVHLSVETRVIDDATVDTTFRARAAETVEDYEVFVSSYFTPNHLPWYRTKHYAYPPLDEPEWFNKTGGEHEPTTWVRNTTDAALIFDGRWSHGHPPLWWTPGPPYHSPLMVQTHRYAQHAVATMARPQDCFAISGLLGYHNSQYHHLFGRTLQQGEEVSGTVRLAAIRGATAEQALDDALRIYDGFVKEEP